MYGAGWSGVAAIQPLKKSAERSSHWPFLGPSSVSTRQWKTDSFQMPLLVRDRDFRNSVSIALSAT